jgi:hypothetical protein
MHANNFLRDCQKKSLKWDKYVFHQIDMTVLNSYTTYTVRVRKSLQAQAGGMTEKLKARRPA